MAGILDQLELMGVEVEEIEDGMPKAMPELTTPSFDSFVAFDIETTGSNGAANGDSTLVGHNIKSSDLRYIGKTADKAGVHLEVPFLDTYVLARKFKEKMHWEKVSLGYLADYYGLENKATHRAFSDAEVNVQIYFELQKLSKES